jgi:hypothetical protein
LFAITVREEAVVADVRKALWQDVEQEPANGLLRCEGHRPLVSVSVVFPMEANFVVVDGTTGQTAMACVGCSSGAVTERRDLTVQGYHRFRVATATSSSTSIAKLAAAGGQADIGQG